MTDRIDTAKERGKLAALEGHTPGPWGSIYDDFDEAWHVTPDGLGEPPYGDWVPVCVVDRNENTDEVDARLIAAAPDLKETVANLCDALDAKDAEIERLREALTPSADTKAAYIGEFHMGITLWTRTEEDYRRIEIPWTTIKEVMAAIRARAALNPEGET